MKKIIIRCVGWWKINVFIFFILIIEKKCWFVDNKNKMLYSFKLRMKILIIKFIEICYLMYFVFIIFIL